MSPLSEHLLRVEQLVEKPSGLREVRVHHGVPFAEEVEEDEVLDRREFRR